MDHLLERFLALIFNNRALDTLLISFSRSSVSIFCLYSVLITDFVDTQRKERGRRVKEAEMSGKKE